MISTATRNTSFDILRFLALTGIVLVHSNPPMILSQLRSFDVPLMVFISAICFNYSSGRNAQFTNARLIEYYKKRIIRLVVPSWIFLVFYFAISYCIGSNINIKQIIMCFTLTTEWYFWIIRILVVMAFLAPFFLFTKKLTNKQLIIVCVAILIITELLAHISNNYFFLIFIMCLPYSVYYCLGINVDRFTNKHIKYFGAVCILIYAIIAIILYYTKGEYVLTGKYKYPPQLYYTSYALGISAFLYIIRLKSLIYLLK